MTQEKHNCEIPWNLLNEKTTVSGYGAAVEYCMENGLGQFEVGNGEYCNTVSYCPFCGAKAKTPPILPPAQQ